MSKNNIEINIYGGNVQVMPNVTEVEQHIHTKDMRDSNHKQIQAMTQGEYTRLVAQIAVLREIAEEYSGKTIDNIIVQMEARKKEVEKTIRQYF